MTKRKDCEHANLAHARDGAGGPARAKRPAVLLALAAAALASSANAESVRLWPSAVIVEDTIRLSDVCELRGFDRGDERTFAELTITSAPPPGGSRVIHLSMIRGALVAGGANMASIVLHGASQCAVRRPSAVAPTEPASGNIIAHQTARREPSSGGRALQRPESSPLMLRGAVIQHFNREFARYGGTADIVFDHTSPQVLDLAGPTYQFRIRRRSSSSSLGLIQLEIDVVADGQAVQTVPLVVQVSMTRSVVVARRSINQGATIKPREVELVPLSFTRLNKLGMDDVVQVIGQRAKRFIPAGSLLGAGMLEPVPLVTRGQLVLLASVTGAIRVVTTASAREDGLLGETITVRSVENKRVEFDAVVIGPGKVQVGPGPATNQAAHLVSGGGS